ncbi:MAG: amidohydrolase family protein [Patescibacteria group bacterium]
MIIDAHTHIHLDPGVNGQEIKDLLAAMDDAGIDKAAVFAAPINGLTTERVLAETEPYRDRLFVVGSVSPLMYAFRRTPDTVEEWLASGRVRALKFYTGYEHFYPADERLRPYLELLVKHGRPAIFHMGDLYDKIRGARLKYSHPLHVDDLAADMPDLKIIIAHVGYPWVIDAAEVCYKNKNVYADCSGFVYGAFDLRSQERFRKVWREFDEITESSGKMLFGSDWPISDMRGYVELIAQLAGSQREPVFSGNAENLFGL